MKVKDILTAILLIAFAAFSTWKGMQTIASVSIIGTLIIVYKTQVILLRNIIFNLLRVTKHAKLGGVEFKIGDKTIDSEKFKNFTALTQILLTTTNSEEIGILAEISNKDKFEFKDALKLKLRSLRDKGLISHNNSSMETATEVWITETGKSFIKEILGAGTGNL
jgi:hypothetical protein